MEPGLYVLLNWRLSKLTPNGKYILSMPSSVVYVGNGGCLPTSAQYGTVMYDENSGSMVVYTTTGWEPVSSPGFALDIDAEMAIDKMIESINQSEKLFEMADKYPLVAEALGQLEVALKLCQNIEDQNGESETI